jgi:hypothetical protein
MVAVCAAAAWAIAWGGLSVYRRLQPDAAHPQPFLFDVIQDVDPLVAGLLDRALPPLELGVGRQAADAFRYYARGRLPGARLMGFGGHAYGREFADWLQERDQAWMLLVAEEAGSYRRTLEGSSFRIEPLASARGALVWRITPAASRPRTPAGNRAAAGGASGPGQ